MSTPNESDLRKLRQDIIDAKLAKLEALENEIALRRRLPHLYGQKFYPWQREWLNCTEKVQCLTAANQCGKSRTMMIKAIEWATNDSLWPSLWPALIKQGQQPRAFWYLYPTKEMALSEFNDKWRLALPPQDDPEFGWKFARNDKASPILEFIYKGVSIHFKTYSQGSEMLQAGSCAAVICDEELPEDLISELQSRVAATDGYTIFGFTATLGQAFWKAVVEERTMWPDAWIRQISLFDCMTFEDGTPTMWTKERIQQRIDQCVTKAEVQRRIFGKFVKDEGLRFPQFDRDIHLAEYHPVPKDWEVYCGVDYGSGGEKAHPSSIVFAAVNRDYTQARIIRSWRGDKIQTTAEDVIDMWVEMKSTIPNEIVATYYDYSAADLGIIAGRRSMPWLRADKSRDSGNAIVAGLLKSKAIKFYIPSTVNNSIPPNHLEGFKFAQEFEMLGVKVDKGRDIDHLCDALRYCLLKIPFKLVSRGEGYVLEGEGGIGEVYYSAHETRNNPAALKVWRNDDLLSGEGEFEFWNGMLDQ